jgi:hypothetical protein
MRVSRFAAFGAAVGLGLLGLTGCEFSKTYLSACETMPPSPHPSPQGVSMTIDAPPQVRAGSTFTVTVMDLNINGQRAMFGEFLVEGGASPAGVISIGTLSGGVTFPVTYQFTATGEPGENISITPASAFILISTSPPIAGKCTVDGDPLATIPIMEPAS